MDFEQHLLMLFAVMRLCQKDWLTISNIMAQQHSEITMSTVGVLLVGGEHNGLCQKDWSVVSNIMARQHLQITMFMVVVLLVGGRRS